MNLSGLLGELRAAGVELDLDDLRDAFWLARQRRKLTLFDAPPPPPPKPPVKPPDPTTLPPPGTKEPPPRRRKRRQAPEQQDVYTASPTSGAGFRPARPVSAPASQVIGDRLAMTRAMRPFRKPWRSRIATELDEEQTAERSAEAAGRIWPVFRAGRERWFDADLVLEDDPAIMLWDETAAAFARILRDSAAFHDVRRWTLRDAGSPQPWLEAPSRQKLGVGSLGDGGARRLVLFVTHGASRHWSSGAYDAILKRWRARAAVVILQTMPPHQWGRTPLGKPDGVCAAIGPGDPNALFWTEQDWWSAPHEGEPPGTAYPLIPFAAPELGQWAAMQMGRGHRVDAVFLRPGQPGPSEGDETPPDAGFTLSLLKSESLQAYQLAVYLSENPFRIAFARLVQEAMFGRAADPSSLAELLFGGLVEPVPNASAEQHYAFIAPAQRILQRSVEVAERQRIGAMVFQRLTAHLEAFSDRIARLELLTPDQEGTAQLPELAQAAARMALGPGQAPARRREKPTPIRVTFFGKTYSSTATALAAALHDLGEVELLVSAEDNNNPITTPFSATKPGQARLIRTGTLWQERLDAVVWLGDAPPPEALVQAAWKHSIPFVPLSGTGGYALQVFYGGEPDASARATELDLLTRRLTGILRQLHNPRTRASFHTGARLIELLLVLDGARSEAHPRQDHPRIPIYRAGLHAAIGGKTGISDHVGAHLTLGAVDEAWLVDNLLALDGMSLTWPAGRHAQATIIQALIQAEVRDLLDDTLAMIASLPSHTDTPLLRLARRLASETTLLSSALTPDQLKKLLEPTPGPDPDDNPERAAQDFLAAQTVPGFMAAFRRLEVLASREQPPDELARSDDLTEFLVQNPNRSNRVIGYVHALYHLHSSHWPLWAERLPHELAELNSSRDTRLIWLLFLVIKAHLSVPLPPQFSIDRIENDLARAQQRFLEDSNIDNGGECKILLSQLLTSIREPSGPSRSTMT